MTTPLTDADRRALVRAWPWPKEAATTEQGFEHVCEAVERIVAARVAEAHRADAELWVQIISGLEALASRWEDLGRSAVYGNSTSGNYPNPTPVKSAHLRAARDLRAVLRGESLRALRAERKASS